MGKKVLLKINWEELEKWRLKDENEFPVLSMISFYKAVGIYDIVEQNNVPISPIEHITANLNTLEKIKDFIKNNWKYYNVALKNNNTIIWKEGKWKNKRKDPLTLSPKLEKSIFQDYYENCPYVDNSLENDMISFSEDKIDFFKKESTKEKGKN